MGDAKILLASDALYILIDNKLYCSVKMEDIEGKSYLIFTWYTNSSMPASNIIKKNAAAVFDSFHPAQLIPILLDTEHAHYLVDQLPNHELLREQSEKEKEVKDWIKMIREKLDSGFADVEYRGTVNFNVDEIKKMWITYFFNT